MSKVDRLDFEVASKITSASFNDVLSTLASYRDRIHQSVAMEVAETCADTAFEWYKLNGGIGNKSLELRDSVRSSAIPA